MVLAAAIYKLYLPTIKGKVGENKVKRTLNKLNPDQYIQFHDLYIPIENGKKNSQIDHLVFSTNGIFVIETKNYKGWITGSEHVQYWNQTNYKRKDKFNNPIRQNYGHIQALKEYLGELVESVPIYSIIVFGDDAELKFKSEFQNATVIKRNKLLDVIYESGDSFNLNSFQLKKIQQRLEPLSNLTKEEKNKLAKNHKTEIKTNLKQKSNSLKENICPKCGNQLVVRNGKHGKFKGCSDYPKCRFTA